MKVLLVTGKLAETQVKEVAKKFKCKVYVTPVEVASLIKPKIILKNLTDQILKNVDIILVPGLIKGNLNVIQKILRIKIFKGTRDISDIPYVLENINSIKLSKDIPADILFKTELKDRALEELDKVNSRKYIRSKLKSSENFLIGDLPVGVDFPIRVVAEIVNAGDMKDIDIVKRAKYYIREGADIIDIGMDDKNPSRVKEIINLLRPLNIPLSIDTMEKENIKSAIKNGIDLILSFDYNLLMKFNDISIPSVIIPKKNSIPSDSSDRQKLMENNIKLALKRGFSTPIADLVLQPPMMGLVNSLITYKRYSEKHTTPILMGIGNSTELLDSDSTGINAVLSAIAMECNVNLIFTTEASGKTVGSVKELSTAVKMMFICGIKKSIPVNLGIDLLINKEKKIKRDELDKNIIENIKNVKARCKKVTKINDEGYFRIFIKEQIYCVHYYKNTPHFLIYGKNARKISDTIFSLNLIKDIDHALYLGRELQKAEQSLTYNRSYTQT
jgi:dihydropteroate synthase-like protein|tara:strand:+ start:2323 stop:3825 length:1503 start_codon:yes stop_codon:yes gene_type:complete